MSNFISFLKGFYKEFFPKGYCCKVFGGTVRGFPKEIFRGKKFSLKPLMVLCLDCFQGIMLEEKLSPGGGFNKNTSADKSRK